MVEFVSYNGAYPNLCSGTLVLRINGENVEFDPYCMHSGGTVLFDDEWNETVTCGFWSVDIPEEYLYLDDEITECVNDNVPWGCCGGCI